MKSSATVFPSDKLTDEFVKEHSKIACDFLRIGLKEFHRDRNSEWQHYQVSLANLCIGIELLVKAYLAKQNLSLIFVKLPPSTKVFITCPESAPENFNWSGYSVILRTGSFKTINMKDAFSMLIALRPNIKPQIDAHIKILSEYRNAAVHNICAKFDLHIVERAAYVSIELMQSFIASNDLEIPSFYITENDRSFLKQFSKVRSEQVRQKLNNAVENAKNLSLEYNGIDPQGWEEHEGICPVCKRDVLLHGRTELDTEWVVDRSAEDASEEPYLTFFAEEMECESCGLRLEDSEELSLAGVEIAYDKTDSIHQWLYEEYGDWSFN